MRFNDFQKKAAALEAAQSARYEAGWRAGELDELPLGGAWIVRRK